MRTLAAKIAKNWLVLLVIAIVLISALGGQAASWASPQTQPERQTVPLPSTPTPLPITPSTTLPPLLPPTGG